MTKLSKKFNIKGIKEFLGVEDLDDEDEFVEELENVQDDKKNRETEKKIEKNDDLDELDFNPQRNTQKEDAEDEKMNEYQSIFIDPKDFSDCKKIAKFIKSDRMITINFEYLEPKKAQRMMDFLMGAMRIKGASFIEISKKVYTSVPKTIKVYHEGKKEISGSSYSMEQE